MRTHRCGDLRPEDIGKEVTLCGWVDRRREHGEHLAFIDLRDRSGVIQVVVEDASCVRSMCYRSKEKLEKDLQKQ